MSKTDSKPIPWWMVFLASGVGVVELATPALPFPGSAFITLPIVGAVWWRKLGEYGVDKPDLPDTTKALATRKNPYGFLPLLMPLLPVMGGVAAMSYLGYRTYTKVMGEDEELGVWDSYMEDTRSTPVLWIVNPFTMAALGAGAAYLGKGKGKGKVPKGALMGAVAGLTLNTVYRRAFLAPAPAEGAG